MKFPLRKNNPTRTLVKPSNNYRLYKESLSKDFMASCGYCGVHHVYFGSGKCFHIDHFAPKSKFSKLENEYSNLVYSCPVCNIAKSNDWCSESSDISISNGTGYIDPCDKKYSKSFYRDEAGRIKVESGNTVAVYMYKKLKFGLRRHEIFWLAEYFCDIVPKINEKMQLISSDDPLYQQLQELLYESITQMDKYRKLQKSFE